MFSITRVRLAVLLLIVAPFVLGTPALAGSRNWQGDLVCVANSSDQDYGTVRLHKVVQGPWRFHARLFWRRDGKLPGANARRNVRR